ncbi:MAG: hypothetical protein QW189_05325 [Thermofilaceae archaeon]
MKEVKGEVKAALEAAGFAVIEGKVRGFSGYLHEFDLAVEGRGRRVYVSLRPAEPSALLAELAKALDVGEDVVIAVLGGALSVPPPRGRIRLVSAEDIGELEEKLLDALTRS